MWKIISQKFDEVPAKEILESLGKSWPEEKKNKKLEKVVKNFAKVYDANQFNYKKRIN